MIKADSGKCSSEIERSRGKLCPGLGGPFFFFTHMLLCHSFEYYTKCVKGFSAAPPPPLHPFHSFIVWELKVEGFEGIQPLPPLCLVFCFCLFFLLVYISKARALETAVLLLLSCHIPSSLWLLAPVILIRLTIRFMQALAGPSGMGRPVVWVGWHPWCSPSVWGRWRWAVTIGYPAWMRLRGWRRPVAGSPRWTWVWVRISSMWVRVAVGEALLVGGRLVVTLILIISLVEGPVTLQAVPGWRPAPAASVRRPGWAVEGRAWGLVPRGAWRTMPGWRAPVVGRGVAWRGSVVVASVMVWRGEVSWRGWTQATWPWGAIARLADRGGVGDMWAWDCRGLRQLAAASPWSAGPRGRGNRAAAHRTTALQQNVNKENQNAPQQ